MKIRKQNKTYYYSLSDTSLNEFIEGSDNIKQAIAYFSEMAPIPVVGNYILSRFKNIDTKFCYKHYFMASCLEDIVLLELLEAMKNDSEVVIRNHSERLNKTVEIKLFPLKIFVSTKTGRTCLLNISNRSNSKAAHPLRPT